MNDDFLPDKYDNEIKYANKLKKKPSLGKNKVGKPPRRLAGIRKFGHVFIYSSIASKRRIKKIGIVLINLYYCNVVII
jgi:hypothetical protein